MRLINNKKGEVTLQGVIISVLTSFLFIGVIGIFISMMGADYDLTGYEEDSLSKYDLTENISTAINSAYDDVDKVTIDKSVFDFFSDIYNKIIAPFKFIYRSFTVMIGLTDDAVEDLKLLKIFGDYISAVLTVLVIIGIVMIKFYMGRKK